MDYTMLLPSELIEFIFKMIDLNEYFNLRLVCKRFLKIITNLNIEELVLCENNYNLSNRSEKELKWHFINRSINNIYLIKSKLIYKFMDSSLFNFKYLKCLKIDSSIDYKEFNINQLCKYFKLEHLEFDYILDELLLCLPELKNLYVKTILNGNLTIDSPKLEKIAIKFGLDKVNIIHLNSIKHFETNKLDDNLICYDNLESIYVERIDNLTMETNFLDKFLKLKLIEFNLDEYVYSYYMDTIDFLKILIKEKIKLKRDNLDIYFNKNLILDIKQIDNFKVTDFYDDDEDTISSSDDSNLFDYDTDPNNYESDFSFGNDYD